MAITTKYDGIEYRSRLEARWAAFMRNIGWDTVYEPFDGDGYIPDFLVQGDRPLLIEVKPAVTLAEYEAAVPKAEYGLGHHWHHDIVIVGAACISEMVGSLPRAGLFGEYTPFFLRDHGAVCPNGPADIAEARDFDPSAEVPRWDWSGADWLWCLDCQQIRVRSTDFDWTARTCGHDQKRTMYAAENMLKAAWADACNDVKWRGRAA